VASAGTASFLIKTAGLTTTDSVLRGPDVRTTFAVGRRSIETDHSLRGRLPECASLTEMWLHLSRAFCPAALMAQASEAEGV
jgi:hypothetical protein